MKKTLVTSICIMTLCMVLTGCRPSDEKIVEAENAIASLTAAHDAAEEKYLDIADTSLRSELDQLGVQVTEIQNMDLTKSTNKKIDEELLPQITELIESYEVVQAKLDDDFPSWRDVTGARDTYPGGTDAYIFGGEFALYLQNKYGFSKYAQFWSKAGSSLSLSFCAGIFKKTYGISLSDEWKEFKQSLEVPQVEQISSDDSLFNKKLKIFL